MVTYEHPVTSVHTLVDAIQFAASRFHGQVWWRGQRDFDWPLVPSIFRTDTQYDELSGILRFQQRAPSRYENVPPLEERHSWLFLMQHHRLPTRLLDWTESPPIGCYFGSEVYEASIRHPDMIEDADGAMFALSPYELNRHQVGSWGLIMPEQLEALTAIDPAFDEDANEPSYVIAVRPSEVDIRLMVQLSVFTLNGHEASLDDLPGSDNFLIKYQIPSCAKLDLREELKEFGIRPANLFPDLDYLADEIAETEYLEEPPMPTKEPGEPAARNEQGHQNFDPPSRGVERST